MSTSHQNEDPNRVTPSSLSESRQQTSHPNLFSWSANRSSPMGSQKIRVTILCARSLVKRDLFRLPDPFVKVCETYFKFFGFHILNCIAFFRLMWTDLGSHITLKCVKIHWILNGTFTTICMLVLTMQ